MIQNSTNEVFRTEEGLAAIQSCTIHLREMGRITGKRSRIVTDTGFLSLSVGSQAKFIADFDRVVGIRCLSCGEYFNATDLKKVLTETFCLSCTVEMLAYEVRKLKTVQSELKKKLGEHKSWKQAIGWKKKYSIFRDINDSRLGNMLSKKSRQLGKRKRFAEHQSYNEVGVYHESVAEAQAEDLIKREHLR